MCERELKEINTKNSGYYYLIDINNINDIDLENVNLDEQPCKDIFIYHI